MIKTKAWQSFKKVPQTASAVEITARVMN